jgi:hypothetical protein
MLNVFLFIFGLALVTVGLWAGKIVPPRPVDGRMAIGLLIGLSGVVIAVQALSHLV